MNIYILVNLVAGGGRQSSESLCPAHAFLPRRSRGRPSFVPASLFHRACSLSLSPRGGGFLERRRKSDGRFARPGRGGNDRWREREGVQAGCTGGRGGPSSAGGLLSHLHTRSHIRSWVARHRRRPRILRLRGKGRLVHETGTGSSRERRFGRSFSIDIFSKIYFTEINQRFVRDRFTKPATGYVELDRAGHYFENLLCSLFALSGVSSKSSLSYIKIDRFMDFPEVRAIEASRDKSAPLNLPRSANILTNQLEKCLTVWLGLAVNGGRS